MCLLATQSFCVFSHAVLSIVSCLWVLSFTSARFFWRLHFLSLSFFELLFLNFRSHFSELVSGSPNPRSGTGCAYTYLESIKWTSEICTLVPFDGLLVCEQFADGRAGQGRRRVYRGSRACVILGVVFLRLTLVLAVLLSSQKHIACWQKNDNQIKSTVQRSDPFWAE